MIGQERLKIIDWINRVSRRIRALPTCEEMREAIVENERRDRERILRIVYKTKIWDSWNSVSLEMVIQKLASKCNEHEKEIAGMKKEIADLKQKLEGAMK